MLNTRIQFYPYFAYLRRIMFSTPAWMFSTSFSTRYGFYRSSKVGVLISVSFLFFLLKCVATPGPLGKYSNLALFENLQADDIVANHIWSGTMMSCAFPNKIHCSVNWPSKRNLLLYENPLRLIWMSSCFLSITLLSSIFEVIQISSTKPMCHKSLFCLRTLLSTSSLKIKKYLSVLNSAIW